MRNSSKFGLEPLGLSTKLSTGGGVKPSNALVINILRILCLGFMCIFSFKSAYSQCLALPLNTVSPFTYSITTGIHTFSGPLRIPIGQVLTIGGSADVTFNNLQLEMEVGSRIDIIGSGILTINNSSRVYNCSNDAWEGIFITSPTTNLTVDKSTIEGANFGIRDIAGGQINLLGAKMFNNYNHLQRLTSSLLNTVDVDGSLFLCNPTISPMPVSTTFPSSPRTINAIEISNAGLVILGSGTTGLNTIINADRGIDIYNTSAEIYNFIIRDCDERTTFLEAAIFARNPASGGILNYIIVGGFAANETVSIYNCETGIRVSNGYDVTIYNNYVEDILKHGIQVTGNVLNNSIDIQGNTLDIDYIPTIIEPIVGIYSLDNNFANVLISNNTLTLNGLVPGVLTMFTEAYGILANESTSSVSAASIKVVDNNVHDFSIGIRLGNTVSGLIESNEVNIPNSTEIRRGIYGVNNDALSILYNRVSSTGYFEKHRGINTQSGSTTQIIHCNQIWDGGRQIYLQNTDMILNDGFMGNGMRQISGAHTGLVLANSSSIGTNGFVTITTSIPSDNHWDITNLPYASTCINTTGISSFLPSEIYYRPNVLGDIFDPIGPGCWVGTTSIVTNLSSTTPAYYCGGVLMREGEDEPVDPRLLITYENASTFINSLKNKSYQTIWDLQNGASLLSLDIITDNDSLLAIFSEFPFAEEALRMEQVKNLMSNSDFDQALELLQNQTWELEGFAYQAWMNILIITNPKDDEGNYDDATIETLTTIANLCPYVYGSAVFEARTKLQWGDLEENEECDAASLNPESYLKYGFEGTKNRQTKISLSPQPVAQGKEITLSAIGSDIAEVKLLSLQGTFLWNTQLSYQSKSIKIQADFQPGIYLLQIKLSTGETQVRKIIIQ